MTLLQERAKRDQRRLAVMTHDEIAFRLFAAGLTPRVLSRTRVQQLERRALAKLERLFREAGHAP